MQVETSAIQARQIDFNQDEWLHVLIAMGVLLVVEPASFIIAAQTNIVISVEGIFLCIVLVLVATTIYAGFFVVMTDLHGLIGTLLERYLRIPRSYQHRILRFMTYCLFVATMVGVSFSFHWAFNLSDEIREMWNS